MKKVLFYISALTIFVFNTFGQNPLPKQIAPAFSFDQYGVKIEPDKRLIVVMAALEAAGAKTPLTEKGEEFRSKLKADMSGLDPALQSRMQSFFESYKKKHSSASASELAAPFISLAYTLGPVPDLNQAAVTSDLPQELLEVLDFAALVKEFYRSARMEEKMPGYMEIYKIESDKMRVSAENMILSMTDYLHTKPILAQLDVKRTQIQDPKNKKKKVQQITRSVKDRRFFIVPEVLAPAGTINFRNIGDDYFAVVPPNVDLSVSEVRRAYLQFVLDPIVLKYAKDIGQFRDGIKSLLDELKQHLFAKEKAKNPAAKIEDIYVSPDIYLAVVRSLVAAADANETQYQRVRFATLQARRKIDAAKGDAAKKAVSVELDDAKKVFADEAALELSESYERGAVLAFYFADQLKGIEDSGFDIASSLKEIILSLNPATQSKRINQYDAGRQRALARKDARNKALIDKVTALKPVLDEVEILLKAKSYPEAETKLKELLNKYPGEPRIYYGLGRVSSLLAENAFDETLRDKRLEDAKLHYSNALRSSTSATDPALIQLCYVALGRIYEFNDETDYAIKIYETALKYGKADEAAYNQAQAAIAKLKKPQQ